MRYNTWPYYIISQRRRGATCSGKTTLAKHLRRILPNSVIVHQDVRIYAIIVRPEHLDTTSHNHMQDFAPVRRPS